MGDEFYDDDFNSDDQSEENEAGSDGNLHLVQVPGADGLRADDTDIQAADKEMEDMDRKEESSDEEFADSVPTSARSSKRRSRKNKMKIGSVYIDMTPPDKQLNRLQKKAKKYISRKKHDLALKELIRCTALARIVYGDGHWKLARAYAQLAQQYFELKGYTQQAQLHADAARVIMISGGQLTSDSTDKANILHVLLTIYYIIGRSETQLKKYADAEANLNKAKNIAREYKKVPSVLDSEVEDWNIKLNMALGKLHAHQQKCALALTDYDKALGQMEEKYGKDSVELIAVYQAMGRIEQSMGDHANHEQAIEHFLQAHSIAANKYRQPSVEHVEVAETAYCLAAAYATVGGDEAETSAESYLNDCLTIYQGVFGDQHEKSIQIKNEIARLMIRTDRQNEGIEMLRSTMEDKKLIYGDLSVEVAESWKLIGNTYLVQGDVDKSLRALKKCHSIESTLYGSNNRKSKDTQRTIDLLLANPNIAAKQKKTMSEQLKERPRFSCIVSRSTSLGGYKTQVYD